MTGKTTTAARPFYPGDEVFIKDWYGRCVIDYFVDASRVAVYCRDKPLGKQRPVVPLAEVWHTDDEEGQLQAACCLLSQP